VPSRKTRSKRRIDPPALVAGNIQMREGVWYALQYDVEITECCDCGLVHETEYKLERGRLWWRSRVNPQATVAARRQAGITGIRRAAIDKDVG
jgi:hypothetical protein